VPVSGKFEKHLRKLETKMRIKMPAVRIAQGKWKWDWDGKLFQLGHPNWEVFFYFSCKAQTADGSFCQVLMKLLWAKERE